MAFGHGELWWPEVYANVLTWYWYIFYGRSALVCCCRCNCSTRLPCFCSFSNVVAFAHNEVVLLPKPNRICISLMSLRDLCLYKGIQLCLFYTNVWLFWVICECLGICFFWGFYVIYRASEIRDVVYYPTKARDVISSRRMTGRLTREDRRRPITEHLSRDLGVCNRHGCLNGGIKFVKRNMPSNQPSVKPRNLISLQ